MQLCEETYACFQGLTHVWGPRGSPLLGQAYAVGWRRGAGTEAAACRREFLDLWLYVPPPRSPFISFSQRWPTAALPEHPAGACPLWLEVPACVLPTAVTVVRSVGTCYCTLKMKGGWWCFKIRIMWFQHILLSLDEQRGERPRSNSEDKASSQRRQSRSRAVYSLKTSCSTSRRP